MAVLNDRKYYKDTDADDEAEYFDPVFMVATDYYPFGYEMPGRKYNFGDYRYGFNGKENDSDGEFSSLTHYDYGFRIYNPAIGRFLSVDPLANEYAWYSPYQFAGNKPIWAIDREGAEVLTVQEKQLILAEHDPALGNVIIINPATNIITHPGKDSEPQFPLRFEYRTDPSIEWRTAGGLTSEQPMPVEVHSEAETNQPVRIVDNYSPAWYQWNLRRGQEWLDGVNLDVATLPAPGPKIIKGAGKVGNALKLTKIPGVRNGKFAKWFNSISSAEFNNYWANPRFKLAIKSRLRHPGGMHEWLLVSRANVFKSWGISFEQSQKWRTAIKDVKFVNPSGVHGGKGSTKAHNEMLEIIDSSKSFNEFRKGLNEWAEKRLKGGASSLPDGLRQNP